MTFPWSDEPDFLPLPFPVGADHATPTQSKHNHRQPTHFIAFIARSSPYSQARKCTIFSLITKS
jgi:hypothetical protein